MAESERVTLASVLGKELWPEPGQGGSRGRVFRASPPSGAAVGGHQPKVAMDRGPNLTGALAVILLSPGWVPWEMPR